MASRSIETSAFGRESEYNRHLMREGAHGGESADALRRRADALLDEMMLGGVDAATGSFGHENGFHQDPSGDVAYANGVGENGHLAHDSSFDAPAAPTGLDWQPSQDDSWMSSVEPAAGEPYVMPQDRTPAIQPSSTGMNGWQSAEVTNSAAIEAESARRGALLIPAEDRYARSEPAPGDLQAQNSTLRQGSSAVRRQSASLASSMTIGARANSRSPLLPRTVELDAATAEQEIQALLSEIAATLPYGSEAAERGRHLLGKAENILQSDPSRTAEVEYYLQQVRRIVQRTRQTHTYSALYRRRLSFYLTAWIALSVTVLAACYLLQAELLGFLEDFFWTSSDSIWVLYAPMTIGVVFAGALGAAMGVLINMGRHAAQEYGYFDRKYGLRGLLLPILGATYGLVLAGIWVGVCFFAGLDVTNLWISLVPTIFAFMLGFAQEWLYGAR